MGKEEITNLYFWPKKVRIINSKLSFRNIGVFVYEYLRILKTLIILRVSDLNELATGLYRTRKPTISSPNPRWGAKIGG